MHFIREQSLRLEEGPSKEGSEAALRAWGAVPFPRGRIPHKPQTQACNALFTGRLGGVGAATSELMTPPAGGRGDAGLRLAQGEAAGGPPRTPHHIRVRVSDSPRGVSLCLGVQDAGRGGEDPPLADVFPAGACTSVRLPCTPPPPGLRKSLNKGPLSTGDTLVPGGSVATGNTAGHPHLRFQAFVMVVAAVGGAGGR